MGPIQVGFSTHCSRLNQAAWEWAFPFAVQSSRLMAVEFGCPQPPFGARSFNLNYRQRSARRGSVRAPLRVLILCFLVAYYSGGIHHRPDCDRDPAQTENRDGGTNGGEAMPLLLAGASERERRAATWIPQPLTRRLLVRKTIRIMSLSDARKARAETAFKRKEDQARYGAKAWAEYEAKSRAIAKTWSA